MKIITTIILLAMILFLVQPALAQNNTGTPAGDCCSHKTKSKTGRNTKACNPFVNCCYRTFEVMAAITLKPPVTTKEILDYPTSAHAEQPGFLNHCWHPPRKGVV